MPDESRRDGIDLARWVAFVGMVLVNFRIVMGGEHGAEWLLTAVDSLSGRAAALFVVLAGFGLAKTAARAPRRVILRRAAFLFGAGLLNTLVFEADILHFYGVYFAIGAFVVGWQTKWLGALMAGLIGASALLIVGLDYDQGWDWQALTYTDLWTLSGMIRSLFYNGWHPVMPWLAFLLLGVVLARFDWQSVRARGALLAGGVLVAVVAQASSAWLIDASTPENGAEVATALFGTSPIPPMPLYVLAAAATAVAAFAACLLLADAAPRVASVLAPAGRQTLTLYLVHILIGMGAIEACGWIGNRSIEQAVLVASGFCVLTTLGSWLYAKRFRRGPVEALMRWCTR